MGTIRRALMLSVFVLAFFACKRHVTHPSKTFVLIAGSWHGAWVWQDIKGRLEHAGQNVIAIDLPAHGQDSTPPQNVSIEIYRDKVVQIINAIQGKVILVGHSMAGAVITAVSEQIPGKIDKLVYIAAYIPTNGKSLGALTQTDTQSMLVSPNIQVSKDRLLADVVEDKRTEIFCQDCLPEQKKFILDHYRPEPLIPFTNPITVSSVFASMDKIYIHTLLDHAVGPELQKRMIDSAGITQVYTFNTGHSPFLSKPEQFTDLLLSIGK